MKPDNKIQIAALSFLHFSNGSTLLLISFSCFIFMQTSQLKQVIEGEKIKKIKHMCCIFISGSSQAHQCDVERKFLCNESFRTVQVINSSSSTEKSLQNATATEVELYFLNRMKDMSFTKGLFPELV